MSEREFELYLSVLSRLLQLSPDQRAEIADELRDDLETRFQDLCKQGHDREAAIQLAIEELGDASGLANHFTTIARQRKRRLIMRYSLTTVAVLACVFLGLHAFAPRTQNLDGPKVAEAQFGGGMGGGFGGGFGGGGGLGGGGGGGHTTSALESENMGTRLFVQPRQTTIPDKISIVSSENSDYPPGLRKSIKVNFDNEELPSALQDIAKKTGVPIFIDHKSLDDEGLVASDIPVPRLGDRSSWDSGDGLTGWQILNTICRLEESQAIGWHIRNGTVWIRGKSDLSEEPSLQRTTYDLSELLETGMDFNTVISLIQTLSGGQWQDIDGDGGSIVPFKNTLSIKTTSHVHQRIGTMLQAIATYAARNPPPQTEIPKIAANQRLNDALAKPISLNFDETPLADALDMIEEDFGVACRIDHASLNDDGVNADDLLVSLDLKQQQPLRVALKWILEPLELAIDVADGNVWIISEADALDHGHRVVFYDVREIIGDLENSMALTETIQSVVDGQWIDIDGEGGAIDFMYPGTLIVKQSRDAHRQITELLEFYRRSKTKVEPKPVIADNTLELRAYTPKNYDPESLVKVIPKFVAPETWSENGGIGSIQTVKPVSNTFAPSGNALIISQTKSVHLQISQFLRGMGERGPSQLSGIGGGQFGGGGPMNGGGGFFRIPPPDESNPSF